MIKSKYDNIDLLKFIAIICVIFIHIVSGDLYKYGIIPNKYWNVANVINSLSRVCVPIFVMVSGALLLSKDESMKNFFKKRFLRIIPSFLLFSIFYYLIDIYYLEQKNTNFIIYMLQGKIFYHLWYIYMILGIYLLVPFFRKVVYNIENKYILYFIIVWFLFMILIPFLEFITKINFKVYNTVGQYIGYFILGYYLINMDTKIFINKYKILITINILFTLLTILLSYYYTKSENKLVDYFYNYHSITVFFQSISIYLIVINLNFQNFLKNRKILKMTVDEISRLSFNIYLIHPIILLILERNIKLTMNYIVYIIFSFFITILLSYIVAKIFEYLLLYRRRN